jgi:rhodanese-related sulfurtransferase
MSTNPFVCQPNSQKIGGFLPSVRGSCAGLIATRRSTPTVSSRMKRVPRPYKTKVPHAESARACDVISMKMMDCLALETLVVNHEPVELIDVRSKKEFAAMHIPGARSVPFGELAATKIFRRRRPTTERVYVISADGHARASLATEILRSAGCVNAVPVDGGMKDWLARGFPLQRKRFSISSAADFIQRAALPLIGAGVALVLREFTAAALLLAIAGVLILRRNSSPPRRRQRAGRGLTHVVKVACIPNKKGEIA